jgi:hypothetical protein
MVCRKSTDSQNRTQGPRTEPLLSRYTVACRLDMLHGKVGEVIGVQPTNHWTVMLIQERNEGEDMDMPLHELRLAMEVLWRMLRKVEQGSQECVILALERWGGGRTERGGRHREPSAAIALQLKRRWRAAA